MWIVYFLVAMGDVLVVLHICLFLKPFFKIGRFRYCARIEAGNIHYGTYKYFVCLL